MGFLNLLMYVGFLGGLALLARYEHRRHPWVKRFGRQFGS